MEWLRRLRRRSAGDDRGVTTVEYGLIIAGVAIVAIPGIIALQNASQSSYQTTIRQDPGVGGIAGDGTNDLPAAPFGNSTTFGPPSAPQNVVVQVLSATSIRVTWSPPSSSGGSALTGYAVVATPAAPDATECVGLAPTATFCDFTGLASVGYTFVVSVSNVNGTTSAPATSPPVTPTTVSPPAPPTAVSMSNVGVVSWTATPVASNGGSTITSYTAQAFTALSGGVLAGSCSATGASATGCSISSGLLPNTQYFVSVYATNASGSGTPSSPRVSQTTANTPAAPTGVAVSNVGVVTWTATPVGSNGGSAVTSYTAKAFDAATGGTELKTCSVLGASATSCSFSGLTAGSTIYVSVFASNVMGNGSPSTPRVSRVIAGLPAAPTAVAMDNVGRVTWTATPTGSNGGSAITQYRASVFTAASGGSSVGSCLAAGPTATSCSVSTLSPVTQYFIEVFATNGVGDGPASTPRVSQTTANVPAAPTNLAFNSGSNKLSWNAPSNGGATITRYNATAWDAATGGNAVDTCSWSSGQLDCTFANLTKNVTYYFDVSATNGMGTGPTSTRLTATG